MAPMTLEECQDALKTLLAAALKCRTAQRTYYRFRDQESLIAAKRAEAHLDRVLDDLDAEEALQ